MTKMRTKIRRRMVYVKAYRLHVGTCGYVRKYIRTRVYIVDMCMRGPLFSEHSTMNAHQSRCFCASAVLRHFASVSLTNVPARHTFFQLICELEDLITCATSMCSSGHFVLTN